jgi:hypothetical protein
VQQAPQGRFGRAGRRPELGQRPCGIAADVGIRVLESVHEQRDDGLAVGGTRLQRVDGVQALAGVR